MDTNSDTPTIEFDYICSKAYNDCSNGDVMILKNIWGDICIDTWDNNDFLNFINCVRKNTPRRFLFDVIDTSDKSYFDYDKHVIRFPQWDYGKLYDNCDMLVTNDMISNLELIYDRISDFNNTKIQILSYVNVSQNPDSIGDSPISPFGISPITLCIKSKYPEKFDCL